MKMQFNIPITINYDEEFKYSATAFKQILERELLEPEMNSRLCTLIEEAKTSALDKFNSLDKDVKSWEAFLQEKKEEKVEPPTDN